MVVRGCSSRPLERGRALPSLLVGLAASRTPSGRRPRVRGRRDVRNGLCSVVARTRASRTRATKGSRAEADHAIFSARRATVCPEIRAATVAPRANLARRPRSVVAVVGRCSVVRRSVVGRRSSVVGPVRLRRRSSVSLPAGGRLPARARAAIGRRSRSASRCARRDAVRDPRARSPPAAAAGHDRLGPRTSIGPRLRVKQFDAGGIRACADAVPHGCGPHLRRGCSR